MALSIRQRYRNIPHCPATGTPRLSRLAFLLALYAENRRRLGQLLGATRLVEGGYLSDCGDGLTLAIDVIETHRYTIDYRLSYPALETIEANDDCALYVRVYEDARQAEAASCQLGPRWFAALGLRHDFFAAYDRRLRVNVFLSKWLEHLAGQGHSPSTLRRIEKAS